MSEEPKLRIRIKIDTNEFEEEGSADSVERQIALFERLIGKEALTPTLPPPLNLKAIMAVTGNCQTKFRTSPETVLPVLRESLTSESIHFSTRLQG